VATHRIDYSGVISMMTQIANGIGFA